MSLIAENRKLFRSFKKGDAGALLEILENERSSLYDYLMRMTGQMQKSTDTIEEVFMTLNESILSELDSFEDLRLMLYTTARKFNADIWNANTALLENAAIGDEMKGQEIDADVLVGLKQQQDLDREFRNLKPFDREVCYLRLRTGLAFSDISDALGHSQESVEISYESALEQLTKQLALSKEDAEELVHEMTKHPVPARSSHATVNLSMVMEGIKTRPSGVRSVKMMVLLGIIALLLIVWIFFPSVYDDLSTFVKGLF